MDHIFSQPEQERDPARATELAQAWWTLYTQFQRTGALGDLEEAVENIQRAVSLAPDGHPDIPMYLNNLGSSFESRFQRTGMLSDLEEAIKIKYQAISLTPDDDPSKPGRLNNLGISFESRFQRIGTLSDLEEAIKNKCQAVSLTPDDNPSKPMYLSSLGNSFESRFGRTGMLCDLEEAIKNKRQAVSLAPDDHPDKSMCLNNLGNSLESRFGYTGMLNDLEEAIKSKLQAVSLTPDDHPSKPGRLYNLGISFGSRFEYTGTLSDLEEAIKSQRRAVSLTPDDHPDKPMYFSGLGNSSESGFGRTGMLGDLEEAIENQRQAVSLTPSDHPLKPIYLNNLGVSLESRFKHTGMLGDLEEAIKSQRRALSLIPDDHPNKAICLNNLGISLEIRFQRAGLLDDLDKAISSFQSAANFIFASILLRCHASRRWAQLEAKRNSSSALIAYRQAINLLPQVAWIGDPIATRHSQLTNLGDLPREAAAFALDVGQPNLALEWLEQGRSIVWNQLLHLRTSIDHLYQAYPELCTKFTRISHELQNAATRGHNIITASGNVEHLISLEEEEETQRHHRLAEKWDLLVREIRSLPNFHDFLLSRKISALIEAANSGPVVVINVHERRCDALVLTQGTDDVLHIPLDKFRYEDVIKMSNIFKEDLFDQRYRGSTTTGGSPRLSATLSWLYLHVVDPVLEGLGLKVVSGSNSSSCSRIWWCPTGPLTFLPLHAACHRIEAGIEGTFSYVISSYIPTVNALLEARAVKRQAFNQIIGVAMTDTPNYPPLPDAETEILNIRELFSGRGCEILQNEQATGEQVLTRMADSSWVHLACHAARDEQEPTLSGFYLHDRRLTIMDIVAKPFCHADFAFLSACQTAIGDENVSDEAIHITGAMLGAGYRSVIGTMWAIPDEAASRVATKVYEVLLLGGEPDSYQAAQALHEAVREMRESDHDSYAFWVPFVHYGT